MQLFFVSIRARLPRLSKATYSTVTLEKGEGDSFTVVATWPATSRSAAGVHRILFNREKVLGRTANKPQLQQRLVHEPCRFHNHIIAEVLQKRGL